MINSIVRFLGQVIGLLVLALVKPLVEVLAFLLCDKIQIRPSQGIDLLVDNLDGFHELLQVGEIVTHPIFDILYDLVGQCRDRAMHPGLEGFWDQSLAKTAQVIPLGKIDYLEKLDVVYAVIKLLQYIEYHILDFLYLL